VIVSARSNGKGETIQDSGIAAIVAVAGSELGEIFELERMIFVMRGSGRLKGTVQNDHYRKGPHLDAA
jgi:hypothetical protein